MAENQRVTNWGNYPAVQATVAAPASPLGWALPTGEGPLIARGNGRCYGDAALQTRIVSTLRWNKILELDAVQGLCCCEAGVLLADLLTLLVPRGLFLPVTPGTKYVTVGGAVAANVHGKNHHQAGAFGRYVEALELLTEDGTRHWCSRTDHPDLFRATIGGMGLTGIILTVRFRLRRLDTVYLQVSQRPAAHLAALLDDLHAQQGQEYAVAWLDALQPGQALGRGIVQAARHALPTELDPAGQAAPLRVAGGPAFSVPGYLPPGLLNRTTIRLYNALYYRRHGRPGRRLLHYEHFFYPLDGLRHWNRLYGRPGFVQYQLVLPFATAEAGLAEVLRQVQAAGSGAFLAVLKLLGPANEWAAPISFPMAGVSLALDFPVTPAVLALLTRLDAVVARHGGRLYLAKDARMAADFFRQTYPPFAHPAAFQSCQSQRLGI